MSIQVYKTYTKVYFIKHFNIGATRIVLGVLSTVRFEIRTFPLPNSSIESLSDFFKQMIQIY